MSASRVALVTGASSGIGQAVARALLAEGARVTLVGRDEQALRETAGTAPALAFILPLDVTDRAAVDALPDRLPSAFAAVDLLVNNAGHDVGGRTRFDQ